MIVLFFKGNFFKALGKRGVRGRRMEEDLFCCIEKMPQGTVRMLFGMDGALKFMKRRPAGAGKEGGKAPGPIRLSPRQEQTIR
jgi:hypothetical protein